MKMKKLLYLSLTILSLFTKIDLSQAKTHEIEIIAYPVSSSKITSDFGIRKHPIRKSNHFHHGIDIKAELNTPIRSILDGVVIFSGVYGSYGNLVVIKHSVGLTSHYAHCSSLVVKVGEKVKGAELIALVGTTGASTGPHLHFELRLNGVPLNPKDLIKYLETKAEA